MPPEKVARLLEWQAAQIRALAKHRECSDALRKEIHRVADQVLSKAHANRKDIAA